MMSVCVSAHTKNRNNMTINRDSQIHVSAGALTTSIVVNCTMIRIKKTTQDSTGTANSATMTENKIVLMINTRVCACVHAYVRCVCVNICALQCILNSLESVSFVNAALI